MEEKLRVCFSSLSFQYLPQSHSGCSAMNLPVLLLPPSSIRCRGHCPSVALSAYRAAGEITPKCLCAAHKPFSFEHCIVPAPPTEQHLWLVLKSRSILSLHSSPSRVTSPHLGCPSPCCFLSSSMCEYSETWLDFLAFMLPNVLVYDGSLMSFTAKMFVQPLLACC